MRDNISLFSLGIGFDVDYDFLKRLSNENRGMAQRIYGNQDTSSQLKVTPFFLFCLPPSLKVIQLAKFESQLSSFQLRSARMMRKCSIPFPPHLACVFALHWR